MVLAGGVVAIAVAVGRPPTAAAYGHYDGDTWIDHTSDDGLASDETWSVAVYHVWQLITTDHTVWAATANGLTAGEVTPPNQRQ